MVKPAFSHHENFHETTKKKAVPWCVHVFRGYPLAAWRREAATWDGTLEGLLEVSFIYGCNKPLNGTYK